MTIGVIRGQNSFGTYFALKDSEKVLATTVKELEDETKKLETEILKLKKSKDYAKRVLRDKYHITDDDEKIIFFAD